MNKSKRPGANAPRWKYVKGVMIKDITILRRQKMMNILTTLLKR